MADPDRMVDITKRFINELTKHGKKLTKLSMEVIDKDYMKMELILYKPDAPEEGE